MDTAETLTPAEAGKRARVSRTTIIRALQAEEIRAFRDNTGRWSISPEAVDEWRKRRGRGVRKRRVDTVHSDALAQLRAELDTARQVNAAQAVQLARLEAEASATAAQLAAATAERDAWRDQAQRLADREPERPATHEPPRGFWLLRLFRR